MAKQRLEVEIGANVQGFIDDLSKMKGALGNFAGAIGKLAAGAAIFNELGKAIKETSQGQNILNTASAAYNSVLQQIVNVQAINITQVAEMAAVQSKLNDVLMKNRFEGITVAKITRDISILREDAVDATKTETEQLAALNEALKLHDERKQFLIENTKEELRLVQMQLERHPNVIKFQERYAELMKELVLLGGSDLERRRLTAQITERQTKAEKEHADQLQRIVDLGKKLQEAFANDAAADAAEKAEKALRAAKERDSAFSREKLMDNVGFTGAWDSAFSLRTPKDQITSATDALQQQRDVLVGLSQTFASYFSDVNMGFQGMVEGMITGIKRMAMELAAKAAFLAILGLMFPELGVLGFGKFGKLLFGEGLSGLFSGASGGGGGGGRYVPAPVSGTPQMPQFRIYGKDLKTSLRRN